MAHALYRVASSEGDQIISRRALQETLTAYVTSAGEPGRQEGVPSGTQDVDRAFTQAEVPPRALPRSVLLGVGEVP